MTLLVPMQDMSWTTPGVLQFNPDNRTHPCRIHCHANVQRGRRTDGEKCRNFFRVIVVRSHPYHRELFLGHS